MSDLVRLFVQATALGESDIRKIISSAPERYKTYAIKKRNGVDRRIISQPAKELKLLQRVLMDVILGGLPIHPAAMAYRKGVSIADNAKMHAKSGPILKFDLSDFFPSIKESDWRRYCEARSVFRSQEDIDLSGLVLFKRERGRRELRLSIGAPSSPMVSNIIMHDIDDLISKNIVTDEVVYSRYADDMTFSAPRTGFLNGVEKALRRILKETDSPNLRINEGKTVYATKKYRRQITGLVLTNEGGVSVGRDRKRNLSAAIHAALNGKLSLAQVRETVGLLSFVSSVEPDFLQRIRRKYGERAIQNLLRMAALVEE